MPLEQSRYKRTSTGNDVSNHRAPLLISMKMKVRNEFFWSEPSYFISFEKLNFNYLYWNSKEIGETHYNSMPEHSGQKILFIIFGGKFNVTFWRWRPGVRRKRYFVSNWFMSSPKISRPYLSCSLSYSHPWMWYSPANLYFFLASMLQWSSLYSEFWSFYYLSFHWCTYEFKERCSFWWPRLRSFSCCLGWIWEGRYPL